MACRFPGGSESPRAYWDLLESGRSGVVGVPPSRWDSESYYDPDTRSPGKIYTRHGGFLESPIDRFDASFFGISPHEAWPMDPGQRLLMEVTWECLEHAGIPPHTLMGSDAGVFVGMGCTDYALDQMRLGENHDLTAYHGPGTASSFGSGRLSHFLGAQGPCVSIDTACSSSMVATLLAAESLWSGECRMALAGGVNVLLSPTPTMVLCRLGALSPTDRCRAFDAAADGYVRGEGVGMVALKTLEHAVGDGDRVIALIRAGAWGHDGRSSSLTVPRLESQQETMQRALDRSGLEPWQIGYVEAHGTGTPVGDPVEATAIGNVLGSDRGERGPLVVGSVKTNIGHLELASGIASIIKVALSLQHRRIPSHLHLEELNPHVEWDRYALAIPRETVPWEPVEERRIAGINSFGLSGTNAHLILEEAPPRPDRPGPGRPSDHVLTVSGRTDAAVRDLAARYRTALTEGEGVELRDFCHTTNACRTHQRRRIAVIGSTPDELSSALEERAAEPIPRHRGSKGHTPKIAFLCTGQGAQYPGMGRALLDSSTVFRSVIDRCDEVLRPHLEHPLRAVLYDEEFSDLIHRTEYTQPALFAVEVALATLWRSLGVEPTHVTGHSLGEYVAATLSGVFELEDALRLVARRGSLMRELTETGSMAAVFASEERVLALLERHPKDLALAAINGPENVVVSGRDAVVAAFLDRLSSEGIGYRELDVSHAFHSPLMEPMLDRFEDEVRAVGPGEPSIPLISNVTGTQAEGSTLSDPTYWRRHVRLPVRFGDSVRTLREAGVECFLEIGPHPTLLGMAALSVDGQGLAWVPSLRRGHDDERQIREAIGNLYEAGVDIDWTVLDRHRHPQRVTVPTYSFQGKRHWYRAASDGPARRSRTLPVREVDAVDHPLLGTRLRSPAISGVVYQGLVERDEPRYLGSYRIGRTVHAPAAVLLEAVLAGVKHGLRWQSSLLSGVQIHDPMTLPRGVGRVSQVIFEEPDDGSTRFTVQSAARHGSGTPRWTLHLSGTVERASFDDDALLPTQERDRLSAIEARCAAEVDVDESYRALDRSGIRLGPAFHTIRRIGIGDAEALAEVEVDDTVAHEVDRYAIHPTLLDALFRLAESLDDPDEERSDPMLATRIEALRLHGEGTLRWIHGTVTSRESGVLVMDLDGYDEAGRALVSIRGSSTARVPRSSLEGIIAEDEWSYGIEWRESGAFEPPSDLEGNWLILEDGAAVGASLAAAIEGRGATVHRCTLDPASEAGGDRFSGDPDDRGWPARLMGWIEERGAAPLDGIVSTLETGGTSSDDGEALLDRSVRLCSAITGVVREATRRDTLAGPLVLLTRGAVTVSTSPAAESLSSSTLWGLQPVLRSELSELRSTIIDLDPAQDIDAMDPVLGELGSATSEDRVAYRQGTRFVPRLARFREGGPTREKLFSPDRAYLVSGGLGGVGKAVTEWLAGHGVGIIAANARRAPDEETIAWIERLRRGGTRVEVVLGDVSRHEEVESIFERITDLGLELGGVFHAAGALDDGMLLEMTPDRYRRVMAAKVAGTWNLHRATEDLALDHFVLFSSVSAFMGSPLQANYAAANGFMASVAAFRHSRGSPTLCVDWGPWSGRGMAARLEERERAAIEKRGMKFLDPRGALGLLEHHLREQTPRVAIMAVDWQELGRALAGLDIPPFLSELVEEPVSESDEGGASRARLAELDALTAAGRAERLLGMVRRHMADIIGIAPEQLAPDVDARESGLDSLMALELRHRVESELGLTIPATALLDGLSPAAVTTALMELIATPGEAGREADSGWIEGEL